MRATDLAERACLDLSTVSRHLRAQEAAGYVIRSPDPEDGRAMLLSVSDAGRTFVAETRQRHRELVGAAIQNWSDADVEAFTRLASRLAQDMESL
jgi:DNA-binding MarR family transcriptional regulator